MRRWQGLAIGVAIGAMVVLARGWRRSPDPPLAPAPDLPLGARYERESRTSADWIREGFVEMVSPIRPPTSEDASVRIVVYVRWPAGARVEVVPRGDDYTLEMPVGTRADRVEFLGNGDVDAEPTPTWRVLDVRGIAFDVGGQRFRVLRPAREGGSALLGIDWARDGKIDPTVTAALGELMLRGQLAGPSGATERERAADTLRRINDCASCHVPLAPARRSTSDPGLVNRGTDASGLYQVTSVLRDRLPFETYRPRDANRGDPLVRRLCGDVPTDARCSDGSVQMGELDVRRGARERDRHVMRVCASRMALAARLHGATDAIEKGIEECGDAKDARVNGANP